jgi:lysophospholipase L1-like esterase
MQEYRAIDRTLCIKSAGLRSMKKTALVSSCLILFGVALTILRTIAQSPVATLPRKVLFIGDSFTYSQGGIYTHFEKLTAAAAPPLVVTTDKAVAGGAFLKRLWEMQDAVKAIDTGAFDVVVLQDDIPETNVDYFRQYTRMFIERVRKNRARPVLFMAWAYPRLGWISMQEIARAHRDLAKELNVDVAPVGLAWQQAFQQRPDLDMYASDREHPSIYGPYLATCVLYATIFNKDPTGFNYVPSGMTSEQAAFLQKIAWRGVQEYRAGRL